jgi:hypothetical protein
MPGDIPCNERCNFRWCSYWLDGHCMDNVPCERQGRGGERETEGGEDE